MLFRSHHRAVEYNVGDLVLLSSRNLSFRNIPEKLQKKFVGPFEVTEKIGAQAYRLKLPENWSIHDVFHISLLKKWKTAEFRDDIEAPTEELSIQDQKPEKSKSCCDGKRQEEASRMHI